MSKQDGGPVVLAVDPGSHKCGVAVVDGTFTVRDRRIVAAAVLGDCVRELLGRHPVSDVVVGDRTGARRITALLAALVGNRPLQSVDEHLSTLEARGRYLRENPPRGIWRWVPLGLQTPPCPVDDYVAVILAERYLRKNHCGMPKSA